MSQSSMNESTPRSRCMSPVLETKSAAVLRSTSFASIGSSFAATPTSRPGSALSGYAYEPLFHPSGYGGFAQYAAATPTFSHLLNSRSRELGHKYSAQAHALPVQRTISPLMLTPLRPSSRELGLGAPITLPPGHGSVRRPRPLFQPYLEKPARLAKPTQRIAIPPASTGAGSPPGPWVRGSLGGPRQYAIAAANSGAMPHPPRGVRWQMRASEGLWQQMRSSEVVQPDLRF